MTIQYTGNDFRIGLIDVGTESGTWGGVTNSNLEQFVKVIGGFKQITGLSGTSGTLAAPAANTSDQDFRNMFLELAGSSSGEFTYTVPDSEKIYIIKNSLDHTVTVKVSGQTGTTIPKDRTAIVYVNGTDAVTAIDSVPNLAIGSATITTALGVPSGGTGKSSVTAGSIVKGAGTGALVEIAGTSAGQVLKWSGSTWEAGTDSGGSGGGSVSLTANDSATASGVSVVLDPSTTTGTGTIGLSGKVDVSDVKSDSVLPIANGGTGADSLNDAGIINNSTTSAQSINSNLQLTGTTQAINFGSSSNRSIFASTGGSDGSLKLKNAGVEAIIITASAGGGSVTISRQLRPASNGGLDIGESGASFRTVFATDGVNTSSDSRLKNSIQESDLGLSFVEALTPRKYKLNKGEATLIKEAKDGEPEEYSYAPGKRFHYGLIAQEVEQVLDEQGVDKNLFGAWHLADKDDPNSNQSLKYHEFISPLIKAVQELSEKVSVLEKKVTDLGG